MPLENGNELFMEKKLAEKFEWRIGLAPKALTGIEKRDGKRRV